LAPTSSRRGHLASLEGKKIFSGLGSAPGSRGTYSGDAENAGLENAGLENVGPNRRSGKGRTGKRGNIMCMGNEM